jgi:HrpA-like RNA helicase
MSLKVGLIGCANTALKNFLPSIEFSDAKLEFIASRSSTKAKDWAERFQSTKFGNYEEVIESDVDMVYIPLPIGLHEEWIIKAAKSGKHILCEKSSTTSFESAKRIIDVCRENNVRILEAFSYKFHQQHEHVKELIKNEIGMVQNFVGRFGFAPPPIENIRWNKKLGRVDATQKILLYGLIINPGKTIHYGSVNLPESRQIFIRQGLVEMEYETDAPFWKHNLDLIDQIEKLEHKSRRQDILINQDVLYQFYENKISQDIMNGAGFEFWRKSIEQKDSKYLYLYLVFSIYFWSLILKTETVSSTTHFPSF